MGIWDVMKKQEDSVVIDLRKGGGMFPTEPPEGHNIVARPGLQKKEVVVHRGGKTFKSTRFVRPGETVPPPEKQYDKGEEQDQKNMPVAQTILDQLGGKQFKMMTGAKYFTPIDNGLMFALPYNFAKQGINKIKITLSPMDTYEIEFWKIGRAPNYKQTLVARDDDVYVESMREIISHRTGLVLNMPKVVNVGKPKEEAYKLPEPVKPDEGEVAVDVKSGVMGFGDYLRWIKKLKIGNEVMLYWTSSGHRYQGKAKLTKVNEKSVLGALIESVPIVNIPGMSGSEAGYKVGHVISVPTTWMDKRFNPFTNAAMPIGVKMLKTLDQNFKEGGFVEHTQKGLMP